jgi:uncharacterized protein (DUF433 family)
MSGVSCAESVANLAEAVVPACEPSPMPNGVRQDRPGGPGRSARPAEGNVPAGEVVRLYRLGLTMAEIAGLYGVSAWIIASRLERAGVRRRRANDGRTLLPVDRAVLRYRRQPDRLAELAHDLGVTAQVIVDRAQRPARGRRGQRRDRFDVPADQVAGLYRAGWTVTRIAARYGTATATVLRRLDEAGVARRPRGPRVQFPVEEAARRVEREGIGFAQLARDYGVGVEAVRGQLRARGVQAPPQTGPRVLRGIPAAELASLYASGLTMAQIGTRYGVSRETIRARLLAAGVIPRQVILGPVTNGRAAPRRAAKPIPVQEAAARYRRGATLAELAASYAVTGRTVRRQLLAAGVSLRSRAPGRIPIPVTEAARLYVTGQTLRQIGARYGVCETVIYDRFTEAGVPLRRKTDRKQVAPELLARLAQQIGLDTLP